MKLKQKGKSLMARFIEAGLTKSDMFHHESDLYVYVTPTTAKIVADYCKENGYSQQWMCPRFINNVDGKAMFDCAFAYEPELMVLDV